MPDEELGQEEQEETQEQEVNEESELSPVEKLAVEIGWNPNHDGGDREFVSAEKFILKSKDIQSTQTKQNKGLQREVAELRNSINMLQKHNDTVYKVQVKQLKSRVKGLEGRRKEALEDGDAEAVSAIDNQITEIRAVPDELPVDEIKSVAPEFEEWSEKNSWYKDNEEMRLYADAQGETNPEFKALPLPKLLKEVTKLVKKKFPENFPEENRKRPVANNVEGASMHNTGKSSTKSKYTYNDLSRSQQDICDGFVKAGIMTQAQYIKDLEIIEQSQGRV